jgi:hypothetical protein
MSSLVGSYFIDRGADTYRTGVVEDEVAPGRYLVRNDWMNKKAGETYPLMGACLVPVEAMCGFDFFTTRQDRDAYVAWLEAPAKPDAPAKVVALR